MEMVQEATKKETLRIAAGTGIGVCIMVAVFAVLHAVMPEQVPFDYRVPVGGILGGAVAVSNFFLMGLTVQQVAGETDDKRAYQRMKASYSQRMMLQVIWIIAALTVPFINGAAGVIPLLFPSLTIKIYYLFMGKNGQGQPASDQTPAESTEAENGFEAGKERGENE